MYHDEDELLKKLKVIGERTEAFEHSMKWKEGNREFMIADIQALCREVANDTGDSHE